MATDQSIVEKVAKLPVSFYLLSDHKAQDLVGFMAQLVQTALNKSNQSLLILVDDEALLKELDAALWAHEATSFIPHQLLMANTTQSADNVLAPVLLGDHVPIPFTGIVLNTTARTVTDFVGAADNISLTRILEIIEPDTDSVEQGRAKYKHYQQLGYELTHFKV